MQAKAKTSALRRLKRIEGQVRGLARMVEMDRYCIDIVTQISAVRAALRAVEEEILSDHVANCVEHAITSGKQVRATPQGCRAHGCVDPHVPLTYGRRLQDPTMWQRRMLRSCPRPIIMVSQNPDSRGRE